VDGWRGAGRQSVKLARMAVFAAGALVGCLSLPRAASACCGPSASTPARLRIDIVFNAPPLPQPLESSAMEEVTRIWAAYGVDVRATTPRDVGRDGAVRLAVVFAEPPDEHVAPDVLGSIRFLGDAPEPRIAIHLDAIARLVSTATMFGHSSHEWPTAFRDVIVGRVLGRALAHEIGHFLLQSRHHAAAGLMRSVQQRRDLVAADRRPFFLSTDEAALITSFSRAN